MMIEQGEPGVMEQCGTAYGVYKQIEEGFGIHNGSP